METIVLAILAFAAGAAVVAALVHINRKTSGDIWDWADEAYEPRHDQPRPVTRVKSNQIEWEIR
jgi:hypothetical protein